METLAALGRRVEATEELEAVTRTMKGLAAVNLRHFERGAEAIDEYERVVEAGLQVALRSGRIRPLKPSAHDRIGTIVFGSNQGLCGPINRRVVAHLRDHRDPGGVEALLAVGHRLASDVELAGLSVHDVVELPNTIQGITARTEDVLVWIDTRRERGVDRIEMVFPRFQGRSGRYEPEIDAVVPADVSRLAEIASRPWPTNHLPMHRGTWEVLMSALTREALFVRIHRAFAQTMAAVAASRLSAMDGAQRNIDDRLDELQRRHHQLRQSEITEELLDVVSGFETLVD